MHKIFKITYIKFTHTVVSLEHPFVGFAKVGVDPEGVLTIRQGSFEVFLLNVSCSSISIDCFTYM